MWHKSPLFPAIGCALIFTFLRTFAFATKENGSTVHPEMLRHLGGVEGKRFFVNENWTMNWMEAKAFCESSNLKLASIESKQQLRFLNHTLYSFGFGLYYWNSAHESRPVRMVWDGTNNEPDSTFLARWFWEDIRPYQYCATFAIIPKLDMDVHECDTFMARPLCQTKVDK